MTLGLSPVARAEPSVLVVPAALEDEVDEAESAAAERGHPVRSWAPLAERIRAAQEEEARASEAARGSAGPRLAHAMDAFLAQDFARMQHVLQAIEDDELLALAAEPGCATLWDLQFRRGLGEGAAGDPDAAARRYAFALALDPERRPSHELFGPDVAQAFLAAVEAQSTRPARRVALSTAPTDARIEVDCRSASPRAVSLRPGLHLVVARAPGYLPSAQIVEVTDSPAPLRLELWADDAPDPVARLGATWPAERLDIDAPSMRAALLAVAEHARADVMLTLRAADDAPGFTARAWVLHPPGADAPVGAAEARGDTPGDAASAALAWVADDGRVRPPPPRVHAPAPSTTTARDRPRRKCQPVTRCWWFWTILGTAAAGLAVGLGVGLSRREPDRLQVFAP